ncbi:hypothetical protein Tco_0025070 [Tanacetum coccineum]
MTKIQDILFYHASLAILRLAMLLLIWEPVLGRLCYSRHREDNKVLIILGRPILATAHARIDVFGGKISLEVRKEQVIFNANEGTTLITVSPVCVIQNFDVIDDIDGLDDLEEFLMNDNLNGDLGNFLQDNNLFLDYKTNSPFLDKSSREI